MLKRIVPTPLKVVPAVKVFALNENTSLSGRRHGIAGVQSRFSVSRYELPFHFTITPTSGAGAPAALSLGPATPPGAPVPQPVVPPLTWKPSQTIVSLTAVVLLPEWKAAT